jgi:hypothetical protein
MRLALSLAGHNLQSRTTASATSAAAAAARRRAIVDSSPRSFATLSNNNNDNNDNNHHHRGSIIGGGIIKSNDLNGNNVVGSRDGNGGRRAYTTHSQLPSEHQMVYEMCRKFADEELSPNASRWDKEHSFPTEAVEKLVSFFVATLGGVNTGKGAREIRSLVLFVILPPVGDDTCFFFDFSGSTTSDV